MSRCPLATTVTITTINACNACLTSTHEQRHHKLRGIARICIATSGSDYVSRLSADWGLRRCSLAERGGGSSVVS